MFLFLINYNLILIMDNKMASIDIIQKQCKDKDSGIVYTRQAYKGVSELSPSTIEYSYTELELSKIVNRNTKSESIAQIANRDPSEMQLVSSNADYALTINKPELLNEIAQLKSQNNNLKNPIFHAEHTVDINPILDQSIQNDPEISDYCKNDMLSKPAEDVDDAAASNTLLLKDKFFKTGFKLSNIIDSAIEGPMNSSSHLVDSLKLSGPQSLMLEATDHKDSIEISGANVTIEEIA